VLAGHLAQQRVRFAMLVVELSADDVRTGASGDGKAMFCSRRNAGGAWFRQHLVATNQPRLGSVSALLRAAETVLSAH
jgi:hypothetical protein